MAEAKNKVAVAGIVSILLVAAVVGVAIGVSKKGGASEGTGTGSGGGGGGGGGDISTSNKAVGAICGSTQHKEVCEKSMSNAKSDDPKILIQAALNVTVDNVSAALKNSSLLREAATDKSTKDAYEVCEMVLDRAIDDLRKSIDQINNFDISKSKELIEDLRVWMSAVASFEETCTDAFENNTSDTGEKMKELLKETKELTSNGLDMVSDLSSILSKLGLSGLAGSGGSESGRKLLWEGRSLVGELKPNAVVALDGSGQFKSINQAIASVPEKNTAPFVILVKAGLYKEYVQIPKNKNAIALIGEGPDKTRITGNKCFANGVKTFQSATVAVDGEDFTAKDIAFENTAGPEGHQAVALRVSNDRALFHNVHVDSFQDSLYSHNHRQFYRNCQISGTIDFIFGDALAIFQKCTFVVRKPMASQGCMVTAEGRTEPRSIGGIVMQGCNIVAEKAFIDAVPKFDAYLGRPWKAYSRTIIMYTDIGGFIRPEGWFPWDKDFALNTLFYVEYENKGPGANTAGRVKWGGIKHFTPADAEAWSAERQFLGDQWIRASGIPYWPNLNALLQEENPGQVLPSSSSSSLIAHTSPPSSSSLNSNQVSSSTSLSHEVTSRSNSNSSSQELDSNTSLRILSPAPSSSESSPGPTSSEISPSSSSSQLNSGSGSSSGSTTLCCSSLFSVVCFILHMLYFLICIFSYGH